jgi:hypothetical protein
LGEIHWSQAAAWRKAIEVFDEAAGERRETVELVSANYRIDDPVLRRRLL